MRRNDAPFSIIFVIIVLLLSFATLTQNQRSLQQQSSPSSSLIPSLAYADKIKLKNKSLINDISEQVVNLGSSKNELQGILQQIRTQISLVAGQDKATNAIKQIKSVIELNPNGPLSESLLFLAKRQAAGNIQDVNNVTTEVARYAASGTDNMVLVLEQALATVITTLRQQQQQPPPLSYVYSNNGIGTPEVTPPMNNNKIITATARGIPNQFVVVLKDSLDHTSNAAAPNPHFLNPGENSRFDSSTISSSRLAVSANTLKDISQQAISMGARVPRIFDSAIHGFIARVPNQQVIDSLAKDPRVAYVEQDQQVQAFFDTLPNGINRIDGDLSPASSGDGTGSVNADIAILDTGIDFSHPDLNIYAQKTFVSGTSSANDDNGHGTHVAGIAAAKDNGYGVVGVAPGARLWDIKVLDSTGSGFISDIVAGIDFIAQYYSMVDIVNLSFGCQCKSYALDSAINNAVGKGMTFVVAAGNAHTDASTFSPANNPNVIAVSAIADNDGRCGGVGPSTTYGRDDSFASFSNYGSTVDMAAPGVNILSTYKGNTYAYMSGTSMAAPHVAGAAALYKATVNPYASPSAVKNALQNQGSKISTECDGNGHGYFAGDPDPYHEPLLYARYL
jgi:Subtilase family/Peptidase inhibitor I9